MNPKRIALYVALVLFNLYVLWPLPSATRVYNRRANSVVRVERFERLTFKVHMGQHILVFHLPWGHNYGHGSGVIIDKRGDVLTAGHVAKNCDFFLITTMGGQVYEAGVLSIDNDSDLALLQPVRGAPRGYSWATLYPSTAVGDTVVHIGCPLRFDWLLTQGVVSLITPDLVVSDTVINPGSSGGALFDIRGRLIGIASGVISPINAYVGHSIFVGPDKIKDFLSRYKR